MEPAEALTSAGEVPDGALPMAVPKKKPRKDNSVKVALRTLFCEYSGRPGRTELHHIKSRGAGGEDIRENLINLHPQVHRSVHDGKINRYVLIQIVAHREELDREEVCQRVNVPVPQEWPDWEPHSDPPTLDEVVQMVISLGEEVDAPKWYQGELLSTLVEAGAKVGWLASQLNKSSAFIRERIKTWRAFPDESMRVPELSWEHHHIAAAKAETTSVKDPRSWITKAADEGWSTRDLKKTMQEEGDPGKAISEEEKELKTAQRVYAKLEEVLAKGGTGGKWLREKLKDICHHL